MITTSRKVLQGGSASKTMSWKRRSGTKGVLDWEKTEMLGGIYLVERMIRPRPEHQMGKARAKWACIRV